MCATVGQKIKKSPGQKNIVKSNKSISRFFCGQIQFFAISKLVKNQIFELGKSLKLPKMQLHEKNGII